MIKNQLYKTAGFYMPLLMLLLIGAAYLAFYYVHGSWVLWFCEHFEHSRFELFEWITLAGEPQILFPFMGILFLLNYGRGFLIFSSWAIATLITILLKYTIANHRPAFYFEETFRQCAGDIHMWYNLSTPSGHSAAAFAFFAAMALLTKSKFLQFLFFLAAILVGLSRIILFMHFFYDVYFGAMIGSVVALLWYWAIHQYGWFRFKSWQHKSWFKAQ